MSFIAFSRSGWWARPVPPLPRSYRGRYRTNAERETGHKTEVILQQRGGGCKAAVGLWVGQHRKKQPAPSPTLEGSHIAKLPELMRHRALLVVEKPRDLWATAPTALIDAWPVDARLVKPLPVKFVECRHMGAAVQEGCSLIDATPLPAALIGE